MPDFTPLDRVPDPEYNNLYPDGYGDSALEYAVDIEIKIANVEAILKHCMLPSWERRELEKELRDLRVTYAELRILEVV